MSEVRTQIAPARFDSVELRRRWIQLPVTDSALVTDISATVGVDFGGRDTRVRVTDDFVYFPVVVNVRGATEIRCESLVFALGRRLLVTAQPEKHFEPFDTGIDRMRRAPELIGSPHGVMYALLHALNDAAADVITYAGGAIETLDGVHGTAAITRMNDLEEIVSRTREGQLTLARAARYLRAGSSDVDERLLGLLLDDIDGISRQASYAHDKLRYLALSRLSSSRTKRKGWLG
ncbi:CorA family divalent cation transporter [Amycolatopsis anabasis]|uniref:CorA family divalent cation transporter n=1 Tax=Amycolatopsis anabasis TaxID=1840409 RepID=UPI00131B5CFD|nr:CorA family divalent cation transporter [Amycolatopsis anabasis]